MKTKIQIKTFHGNLLFEFEKENNTIKETLQEAMKSKAYLQGADLRGAYLQGADLRGANLQEAYLRGANLQGAYLQGADLQGADLRGVKWQEANLQGAYLQGADLRGANLQEAYLQGADLRGANLQEAYLKKIYNQTTILPEGELIIWKKLKDSLIAKLLIPSKTKRVNAIGSRKCRFEYAKVIAIYNGKRQVKEGRGLYNSSFIYVKGETVKSDKFDNSPLIECSHGIHGFITKQEAIDFNM